MVFEGITIGVAAPSAILSLVAIMYFTGKLLPERVHNKIVAEKDRLILSQDQRIEEQNAYIGVLKENNTLWQTQGHVTTQVVQAIPDAVRVEGT